MSWKLAVLLTGMRSAYFWRMRSASAFRFSKGCSSLNLDRMMAVDIRSGPVVVEVLCEGSDDEKLLA
jgi:hypothetical protein